MRILMVTNNYFPRVGGVAQSVASFADAFRQRGHTVLVVTPDNTDGRNVFEPDVLRVPAVVARGHDLAAPLPVPGLVSLAVKTFQPDIIHSHHPFLLGDTALRLAARWDVPLVFTHHTMYEAYTHYVPADLPVLKEFIKDLSTGYANLCDCVFAPSASTAAIIRARGVTTRIEVVPTGIEAKRLARGDGGAWRRRLGIPRQAFVVGYVGRLAAEKNLVTLAEALQQLLRQRAGAQALIVGSGPEESRLRTWLADEDIAGRVHLTGTLDGQELVDAYHAMDVFAFTSLSETQGLVLAEALAAGVPVAALDAPGSRDIIRHGENGWLLDQHAGILADTLLAATGMDGRTRERLRAAALRSARDFDRSVCVKRALAVYKDIRRQAAHRAKNAQWVRESLWEAARRRIAVEWDLWHNRLRATRLALAEVHHQSGD